MALTSPDNIFSPDRSKIYALTNDLSQLTGTVQSALTRRANQYIGTSAEREASSNIPNGVHWQDTDGAQLEHVKLLDSWVPVGGKFYAGTSSQRSAFTNAPEGSHWQDTDNGQFEFVWRGGRWQGIARVYTGSTMITPVTNSPTSVRVNFPTGFFTQTPSISATANTSVPGSSVIEVGAAGPSVSGFDATIYRTNTTPTNVYWIAAQYPEP